MRAGGPAVCSPGYATDIRLNAEYAFKVMAVTEPVKKQRGPKVWCKPTSAFGKVEKVDVREWQPPSGDDPVVMAQFRAAVMQNAIAVHVREFKNGIAMRRTGLVGEDKRLNAGDLWDARLNGHENLTTSDIATLLTILPESLPDTHFISVFLSVAEGGPIPEDWEYPDTSSRGN